MTPQWQAECKVNEALAQQLIETQFPELKPVKLVWLGEGWDNVVYRVNDRYVFRFPRRQMGADLIVAEEQLLPHLASRLPIHIPTPLFFGKPTDEFCWPFLGYQFLAGRSACAMHLTMDERAALAEPLAAFLKALHSIIADEAYALGAQDDNLGKLNVEQWYPRALANLEAIKNKKLFTHVNNLIDLLESLKNIKDDGPHVLIHGDLYARHLLINDHCQLSGIIDWGDVRVGNPAIDLKIVFDFLPPAAHSTFFEHYGCITEQTKQLALFRAICHTSVVVLYSNDIDDQDLLHEGLIGLDLIINKIY